MTTALNDIFTLRRDNIQRLITERFEGVRSRFARAVGARDSHVNNVFSRHAEYRRNVGEHCARNYESALGLPVGWLDRVQETAEPGPAAVPALTLQGLSSLQAATLEQLHRLMLARQFTDGDAVDLLSRVRSKLSA